MRTMTQFSERSAILQFQGGNEQSNAPVRPKIGTDDGISNRGMNILLLIVMLLVASLAVASANGSDELKNRILLRQSMLDMERTDYDAALSKLIVVFSADQENANVSYMLGLCHLHGTKNFQQAAFYFDRAARSVSDSYLSWDLDERSSPVQTFYLLASAHEKAGDFNQAALAYEAYLAQVGQNEAKKLSPRMMGMLQRNLAHCRQLASEVNTDAVAIEP